MFTGVLASCADHQKGFAPLPPQNQGYMQGAGQAIYADARMLSEVEPAAGFESGASLRSSVEHGRRVIAALSDEQIPSYCGFKDRFDRDDVVAYEWGQNRLGMDVDGIGWDSFEVEEVKLTYSLNLQPIKTKKQRCRRASSWQGMVGSGYNEIVVHDGVVVEKKLHELEQQVDDRIGYFFD